MPTLDQSDWGQWVIDDATGQLRMRLATSYRASELGLGHLIGQGATTAQRGAWRGAGYELITQGWATVRAAQGVLISSTARAQNGHSVESTQMDVTEAVAQLKAAQDLGQRLSEAAAHAQAAYKLADERHRVGAIAFIELLDAQRDLLDARGALATSDQELGSRRVDLFKALGGGWKSAPAVATTAEPESPSSN